VDGEARRKNEEAKLNEDMNERGGRGVKNRQTTVPRAPNQSKKRSARRGEEFCARGIQMTASAPILGSKSSGPAQRIGKSRGWARPATRLVGVARLARREKRSVPRRRGEPSPQPFQVRVRDRIHHPPRGFLVGLRRRVSRRQDQEAARAGDGSGPATRTWNGCGEGSPRPARTDSFIAPSQSGYTNQPRRESRPILDFFRPLRWPELFDPKYRADAVI